MKTLFTAAAAPMTIAGAASAAPLEQPELFDRAPFAATVARSSTQAARARVSYGVGPDGQSSETGGPVGGYPNRN